MADGDRTSLAPPVEHRRTTIALWQAAVGVLALAIWESLVAAGVVDPFFVSRPTQIARRVAAWATDGTLWGHLAITLEESLLGLLIGSALGIALGFWFGRSPGLARVFDPYIKMLNAVPRIVLAPLFLLWFGLGIWSKVALAVTLVFFVMFFSTYQGVRDADRVLIDNARMLGASERQLCGTSWFRARSPGSSRACRPAGIRDGGRGCGEYLGSTRGLGYVISQAEGTFDTTGVFAGMTVLAIVVVIVSAAVARVERWLLRWKAQSTQR